MPTLDGLLGQLRVAAARARALRYLVRALLAMCAWVTAVHLIARSMPVEHARLIAAYGLPLPFAVAAIAWIVRQPRPLVLARVADVRLGLKERLSTAWERRDATTTMDAWQRRDALSRAAALHMPSAFPLRIDRGEGVVLAAAAIAALLLTFVPNPMDQVIARRHGDRVSQNRAAETLQKAEDRIKQADPEKKSPVDAQVQKILDDAAAAIRRADSPARALEAISPAEDSLARIPDPSTPQRAATALNLAAALSRTTAGQTAARAIAADPQKGADALKELASQLAGLSEKDRADLAKALAEAAKRAPDAKIRDSIQKAADALAKGDTPAAATALGSLSDQLSALKGELRTNERVASAVSALEAARAELAQQADRDAGRGDTGEPGPAVQPLPNASGRPGPGTSPGSGNNPGSGTNPGGGNNPGSGNNPGGGNNPGSGSGQGTGSTPGGSGGSGTSGGSGSGQGSGSGTGLQARDRVFVPGQPLPGQSEEEPTPLGPGQNVPLRSYIDVLAAYQQAALDIIDRSLIPGSARDLVRDYFSSLGESRGSP